MSYHRHDMARHVISSHSTSPYPTSPYSTWCPLPTPTPVTIIIFITSTITVAAPLPIPWHLPSSHLLLRLPFTTYSTHTAPLQYNTRHFTTLQHIVLYHYNALYSALLPVLRSSLTLPHTSPTTSLYSTWHDKSHIISNRWNNLKSIEMKWRISKEIKKLS